MTVNVNTVFAEGGEAFIYKIDDNHLAKIYKDNTNLAEKEKKVKKVKIKICKNFIYLMGIMIIIKRCVQ